MKLLKKICINCSNLHNGGGVQVASSFINELEYFPEISQRYFFYVSSEVYKNIRNPKSFKNYHIKNTYGIKGILNNYDLFDEFDIVFTVFGPCYHPVKGISIVGFAQPWIIYPNNDTYKLLSKKDWLKTKIKFELQKLFFKNANHLVVELEHVKNGLIIHNIATAEDISVVYNTVANLYFDKKIWQPFKNQKILESKNFKIGLVSRDYSHKNIDILPKVKEVLKNSYNLNVDFFVTLNDDEWVKKTDDFKKNIYTIGSLLSNQCPCFYEKMDAVIFPSLLECFSATPLEAMVMEKPLFASDRAFIRDICGEYAYYFDPLDANSIAKTIYNYIEYKDMDIKLQRLTDAKQHAINFSNAKQRALSYIQIIESFSENLKVN